MVLPNGYEAYDTVFLGYSNWWGTLPAPIVSFLRDHDTAGKTIIPFVTHGGQIFLYPPEAIEKEAPQAIIKEGFAIAAPYMSLTPYVIDEWLHKNEKLVKQDRKTPTKEKNRTLRKTLGYGFVFRLR